MALFFVPRKQQQSISRNLVKSRLLEMEEFSELSMNATVKAIELKRYRLVFTRL
jgi:hypothetical protein